jgi:multidrug efflux pump subunit AcrB
MAEKMRAEIAKFPFVKDLQDDYVTGMPTVRVRIDRQKAALFNLSTNAIGFALKTAYNGLKVSTFYEGDEDHDIVVTLSEDDRRITDVLHKLMIPTSTGQMVPLTTLASIDYTGGVGDIIRINHNRTVTVMANVDEGQITGPVARMQAQKMLKAYPMPPGYQMKFTGENEFQKESEDFLKKAYMIALLLIFLILVTLFNSVAQPLIIMTSIVLSLGGAFLGLYVLGLPFSVIMSGVGVISLGGVVVNNAIVLIDYTNKLRQRGMGLYDAVVAAGATRLRPVLLTAITTVLGLLPMVVGVSFDFRNLAISWASESAQYWRSMAAVVIFGLMVSTALTLMVVPTLYALIETAKLNLSAGYARIKEWYWKPFAPPKEEI